MPLNQLLQTDAQLLLFCAGSVDMPTDAVQLGAVVVLASKRGEPLRASTQDCGGHSHSLYVGDSGWAAIQTHISWEGRLQSGLALLALQGLNQSCLFTCTATRQGQPA